MNKYIFYKEKLFGYKVKSISNYDKKIRFGFFWGGDVTFDQNLYSFDQIEDYVS